MMPSRLLTIAATAVCAFSTVFGLTGCQTNAATGRSQLNIYSEEEEIALGKQNAPELIKNGGGEVDSESLKKYVSNIGHQLAAVSERPDLPWEFHVLNTETVNAFALPGGQVFVTRGILSHMENEAQLAGVLGHEIGHVTGKHVTDRITRALAVQGLAIGLAVYGAVEDDDTAKYAALLTQTGGTLYVLKFSRDQESESDMLGVRYMTKLGYNPVGQIQVMGILKAEGEKHGASGPEFLKTHPNPGRRITDLEVHLAEAYPDYAEPGRYRFHESRFKREVLNVLETLPPVDSDEKQAGLLELEDFVAVAGIDYEAVREHQGCGCCAVQ